MRLIDADKLKNELYHEAFETDSDMQKWDGGCWIRYKMFEKAIESAPTIQGFSTIESKPYTCEMVTVRVVKHGKWLWRNELTYCCSECKHNISGQEYELEPEAYKYCSCCGAKMNGEENG